MRSELGNMGQYLNFWVVVGGVPLRPTDPKWSSSVTVSREIHRDDGLLLERLPTSRAHSFTVSFGPWQLSWSADNAGSLLAWAAQQYSTPINQQLLRLQGR